MAPDAAASRTGWLQDRDKSPWRDDAPPLPLTINGLIDSTVVGRSLGMVGTVLVDGGVGTACTIDGAATGAGAVTTTGTDTGAGADAGAGLVAGAALDTAPSATAAGGLTPFRF